MTTRTLIRPAYMPKYKPDSSCVLYLEGQQDPQSSTIRDLSGYGNHGTIVGASWVREKSGVVALSHDGTDDTINLGTGATLAMEDYDFTFLCWTKSASSATSQSLLGSESNGCGWYSRNSNQNKQALTKTGVTDSSLSTSVVPDNIWCLLGATFNSHSAVNNLTFYLNGLPDGVSNWDFDFTAGVKTDCVGAWSLGNKQYDYLGRETLLRIVRGRFFSATEMAGIHNQERSLFGV